MPCAPSADGLRSDATCDDFIQIDTTARLRMCMVSALGMLGPPIHRGCFEAAVLMWARGLSQLNAEPSELGERSPEFCELT